MTDAMTRKPLKVSTDGAAGPYIMLPVSQLAEVGDLLKDCGISFSIDENAISFDGRPEVALVNLTRGTDVAKIQSILDSAL